MKSGDRILRAGPGPPAFFRSPDSTFEISKIVKTVMNKIVSLILRFSNLGAKTVVKRNLRFTVSPGYL